MKTTDPHADTNTLHAGAALDAAALAVILIHGRGASAASILPLSRVLVDESDAPHVAFVAPQAAGGTWYPRSFLAPAEQNQPYLDSALTRIDQLVHGIETRGVPRERQLLVGFSQGACLVSTYLYRHPQRLGGAAALIGGIAGDSDVFAPKPAASFAGTPIYFAAADPDPHVPYARAAASAKWFESHGAAVTLDHLPGEAHTISAGMVRRVRTMVDILLR
jgi:predicted esterase